MQKVELSKDGLLELIGNTPCIELKSIAGPFAARIFAKLEIFNPTGTIKDRVALGLIEASEKSGLLCRRDSSRFRVVEATSGSMGVSLAFIGRRLGYQVSIVTREGIDREKIKLMKLLGADVSITSRKEGLMGSIRRAEQIANESPNCVFLNQFANEANWKTNFNTTGPELWMQMSQNIDALCIGIGSGGTVRGVAEYVRQQNPDVKVFGIVPRGASLSSEPGNRDLSRISGIGSDVTPPILQGIELDDIITVSDGDAIAMLEKLAKQEGLLVGLSSAAVVSATEFVARVLSSGKRIATIITDSHYQDNSSSNMKIES